MLCGAHTSLHTWSCLPVAWRLANKQTLYYAAAVSFVETTACPNRSPCTRLSWSRTTLHKQRSTSTATQLLSGAVALMSASHSILSSAEARCCYANYSPGMKDSRRREEAPAPTQETPPMVVGTVAAHSSHSQQSPKPLLFCLQSRRPASCVPSLTVTFV